MTGRAWLDPSERGHGVIGLPARKISPFTSVLQRALFALALVFVTAAIVLAERHGYRDSAHPGNPVSFVDSLYYSAVTLTTTGYGDIVPVTTSTRLVNTVVITPLRVLFLITLVGTTLAVLAERTRTGWRIGRWRSHVTGHTIVVGYGTKGRAAVQATTAEVGRPAGAAARSVVAVVRDGTAMAPADPRLGDLAAGDRLVLATPPRAPG